MAADRILTTHVGSLIRPDDLVALLVDLDEGRKIDEIQFNEVLKRSVEEVVRQQAEAGADIVSDGEYGKTLSWSRYILERLSGFTARDFAPGQGNSGTHGKDRRDFADFYAEYEGRLGIARIGKQSSPRKGLTITGPIRYSGQRAIARDIANLKAACAKTGSTGFLPVVAPASVAPDRRDEFYKSEEEALFAIADALNEEYRAIIEAGLNVQIDDAFLASVYDVMVPPGTLANYRKWAGLRIEALNHALRGIPEEKSRYHVCWGSWNGPHSNDVAVKDIIDLVLTVKTGGYSLEMANPRHEHEWRVWETVELPEGKVLVPGLISHATNVLEHPELVAERITRLAKLVGRERVIASTDCGFAQGPFARRVHPTIMWAKLRALSEGARIATAELWRKAA
jgi:5-methyltetrahydropteroyltriglutamate--homocysteine methyltransferase